MDNIDSRATRNAQVNLRKRHVLFESMCYKFNNNERRYIYIVNIIFNFFCLCNAVLACVVFFVIGPEGVTNSLTFFNLHELKSK